MEGKAMDGTIIRMVVAGLGATLLVCIGGMVYLSALGKEVPAALPALSYSCVGALVGILAAPRPPNN